ncbi:MAG: signal peptidase II [Armatimonadetes bacterium]|nr:signal peptidase II [Armatimonadota bacterium]
MLVAGIDQWVKAAVADAIPASVSVTVLPGLLSLTHVQNRGVAFGLFSGASPLITAMAALTLIALLSYNKGRQLRSRTAAAGVAGMAGGALGNLIDRVRLGYVVDYLDVHVWPVFNLADVAIVLGAGLLILALSREANLTQSRR